MFPIELSQPSDTLVLQPTSPSDDGYLDNLLVTTMMSGHCCGFVMNAGMRDVRDPPAMGLLILCTAICAQGAGTAIAVCATARLSALLRRIGPGDAIVVDNDGVCDVRHWDAGAVLSPARFGKKSEDGKRLSPCRRRVRP